MVVRLGLGPDRVGLRRTNKRLDAFFIGIGAKQRRITAGHLTRDPCLLLGPDRVRASSSTTCRRERRIAQAGHPSEFSMTRTTSGDHVGGAKDFPLSAGSDP